MGFGVKREHDVAAGLGFQHVRILMAHYSIGRFNPISRAQSFAIP